MQETRSPKEGLFWVEKETSGFWNQGSGSSDCMEINQEDEALNVMETIDGASWIMNSGCSFHICPNLSWYE